MLPLHRICSRAMPLHITCTPTTNRGGGGGESSPLLMKPSCKLKLVHILHPDISSEISLQLKQVCMWENRVVYFVNVPPHGIEVRKNKCVLMLENADGMRILSQPCWVLSMNKFQYTLKGSGQKSKHKFCPGKSFTCLRCFSSGCK